METTELFYPEMNAQLGKYYFSEGIQIEAYSSSDSYFDWAKVKFTSQYKDKISLTQNEKAVLQLGYNGNLNEIFTGYISKPYNSGGSMNEVILKDDMLLLENTVINNTFMEVTPQEILTYCLTMAGIKNIKLSTNWYPEKSRVPIQKKNVIGVINTIHTTWNISEKFYFSDGVFYWGTTPEQTKIYTFEYGNNIISLNKSGGVWELVTVSAPFIKHSQLIELVHPQISGQFKVKKIEFLTNDSGFIRTHIYF